MNPVVLIFILILNFSAVAKTLYIGDSHSIDCFGDSIREKISQQDEIDFYASCGSSTTSWLQSSGPNTKCGGKKCLSKKTCEKQDQVRYPNFSQLLESSQPQNVVIALGTNMIKSPWDRTAREVERMINLIKMKNSECLWIGPPQPKEHFISFKEFLEFNEQLRKTVESLNCQFLSSAELTDRNQISDPLGLHYSCQQGRVWAQKILQTWPPPQPQTKPLTSPARQNSSGAP
jgi:hypothetical protein